MANCAEAEVISQKPLTILLTLPSGCTAGRYEAAEAFAAGFAELKKYPEQFQLIPFSYSASGQGPALESILAVAL